MHQEVEPANKNMPGAGQAVKENPGSFIQLSSITIPGGTGAAEISAYDPLTKRLFIVNNTSGNNRIDVLDFTDPQQAFIIYSIPVSPYGGLVNSLDVHKGMLAAAVEASIKTNPGKVIIFRTTDYSVVKQVTVGSLPDMITYSPNGRFLITANEGEPNSNYTIDPYGTVSIISVHNDYSVTTLDFTGLAGLQATLQSRGLRIFGVRSVNMTDAEYFASDLEPEYITVSHDSRTAWVTLQENNAIAKIDLLSETITDIFPLGFKNYNLVNNKIDPSDLDGMVGAFNTWPVYGMYQPDGIAVLLDKGIPYLFTANEGDAREYEVGLTKYLVEAARIKTLNLDGTVFPNAAFLKRDENLGRLNITKTIGDIDRDGDYDALYSFGARSFSVWNGLSGALIYDSGSELEEKAKLIGSYPDSRSDDKGVEPEGIAVGEVNKTPLVFIGMERANAVAIYNVSNPANPLFLQILKTGNGPEGVLFISAHDSPTGRSLLVVSSENDGLIKVYAPALL